MLNLQRKSLGFKLSFRLFQYLVVAFSFQLFAAGFLYAQDNSPYSRYGLGDLHPNTNIFTRGMAGLSAGYSDQPIDGESDPRIGKYYPSINFLNPASYSRFLAIKEGTTKKLKYGRMMFDVGVNFSSRTLHEANNPQSFSSSNGYFSYMQIAVPIKKKLGLNTRLATIVNYQL